MRSHTLSYPLNLARAPAVRRAAPIDGDEAIRRALLARIAHQPWWDVDHCNVFVDRGVVVFQGLVSGAQARRAARRAALDVPGVHEVWDARVARREWQSLG